MNNLTQADCLAIVIAAAVALYIGYRGVMWLGNRVIDGIAEMTQFER